MEHPRDTLYFDMLNGIFVCQQPTHPYYLQPAETVVFQRLLKMSYENMSLYAFPVRIVSGFYTGFLSTINCICLISRRSVLCRFCNPCSIDNGLIQSLSKYAGFL